jgi:hypothetical protein
MTSSPEELLRVFDALRVPPPAQGTGAAYTVHPIRGHPAHYVAKNASGAPTLLLTVSSQPDLPRPAPIELEHLMVQHDVECRVILSDSTASTGLFTVVQCVGTDRMLHEYFMRVSSILIPPLPVNASQTDISRAVAQLIELFRAMSAPPRKSLQGLWAELFLITRSRQPVALIRAWHMTPDDRYDFSAGRERVEVKSAVGRVRDHHFSLEQLRPPVSARALIASFFVERAAGGLSIAELADEVRSRVGLHPDLVLHVDRIVTLTLGSGWCRAHDDRFDAELAEDSLAFFDAAAVPSVDPHLPAGVREVRFRSDLTGLSPVNPRQLPGSSSLFLSL